MHFDRFDALALAAFVAGVGAFVFYVVPRIDLAIAVFDHMGVTR
ncbi:hypothetical protein [Enterobacter asburiae]|jgi:hypothetical protein|nr:hypothetical protein [Enterobacter asburiae]